jgi:hypothetical protein
MVERAARRLSFEGTGLPCPCAARGVVALKLLSAISAANELPSTEFAPGRALSDEALRFQAAIWQ